MGLATISANTTIKVSAAVSASRTTDGTIYTCPASSYAIINLSLKGATSTGGIDVTLAGNNLINGYTTATSAQWNGQSVLSTNAEVAMVTQVMIGPSQALAVTGISGTGATIYVTGVEFINSP